MQATLHGSISRQIAEAWPQATVKHNRLDEFDIFRSLNGVSQRCWLFLDDGELVASLFVDIDELRQEALQIRLRSGSEPLKGLTEGEVARFIVRLADDLATPAKVKKLAWSEATKSTRRFAARVPFQVLARAYVLGCLGTGQRLTERWIESTISRLWLPAATWGNPDVVAIEEGWAPRTAIFTDEIYRAAFLEALRHPRSD